MDETQIPINSPNITPTSPIISTTPSKSPLALIIKIIAGVVGVIIVGGGVSLAIRIWDPLWNPFRANPEKVIEKMVTKMKEVKIVHSEMKIELAQKQGAEEVFKLLIVSNSDSDNTDPENPKSAVDFDITIDEFFIAGESRTIDETSYFKIDSLDIPSQSDLEVMLMTFGIDLSEVKNQWIKYDQESYLKSMFGEMYTFEMEEQLRKQKEKQEEMIETIEDILKDKKLYVVKREFPDEKINNVKTYHYLIALNNEEAKKVILESLETFGEEIGAGNFFSASIRPKIIRIKVNMSQMRLAAEIISIDSIGGYSYVDVSCQNEKMKTICDDIKEDAGTEPVIFAATDEYCAYVPLPVDGYYECINTEGGFLTTDIFPETPGYCNGRTFVCPRGITIPKEDIEKIGKKEFPRKLDEFFEKLGEITGEAWIGKKDYYLYKVKGWKEFDLSKFEFDLGRFRDKKEQEKKIITVRFDIENSNFNQPIEIEAPENFIGIEEIISPRSFFQPSLPNEAPRAYPPIKLERLPLKYLYEQPLLKQDSSYSLQASLLRMLSRIFMK